MRKIKYVILIIIVLISNSVFSQNCVADFSYDIDTNNQTIQFYDNSFSYDSTDIATAWFWSIEGDTFSINQNPILQYDTSNFIVCLDVSFDSSQCYSSVCDTFNLPIAPIDSCHADYNYTLDTNTNTITFSSTSYSDGIICEYFWEFSDGTSSNSANIVHTFSGPGIYNVCLTIYSSTDSCATTTCVDTYCDSVVIPNIISEISISGNVFAKTALLPEGIAVLYNVETSSYTAISYTPISNGFYMFNNLDTGNYLVYAIPYFGDIEDYYPLYYPTYAGNEAHYNNAFAIYADTAVTQDINLLHNDDINHGFGNISGKVVYDAGSNFETNIFNQNWFSALKSEYEGEAQNITVLIYNNLGQIIRYSRTDENGNFEFKNLPFGFNLIYTEKAGKETQSFAVYLTEENDTIQNILIHIEETEIINIEEITQLNADIYPIPFNNYLNIDINKNLKDLSISIVDITGKQIFYRNFDDTNPNIFKINTNELKKGSYVILIKSANSIIFRKKIIK